jgi:hypothetical protein
MRPRPSIRSLAAAAAMWSAITIGGAGHAHLQEGPLFLPDDPLWHDNDRLMDAGRAREHNLSQQLDFLENTFTQRGDRRDIRALNVNTLDEVPDSMWFVNRIGHRTLTDEELVRGPDEFEQLPFTAWTIVGGKSSGLQPGFRAVAQGDGTGQLYQIEFDPPDHPDLATGAEMVGTGLYHALGYHVVENYLVEVDPARVSIAPTATTRDRAGRRRPFTRADLRDVLARAHRSPDGTYRGLASRFAKGQPMGNFRYFGQRRDDPNDIYPHEHRRELRGNRVFAAWVNHDDSRAVNTLDMLEGPPGAQYIRHYMFDFGSIMGSGTTGPDAPRSGYAYLVEKAASLRALRWFGLWAPAWARQARPAFVPSAGPFTADMPFDPVTWRAEYPNAAFLNMRADDAFWAARRVAAFSERQIRLIVGRGRYREPAATEQIVTALVARRDRIARAWLTAITPIVAPALSADEGLTFENAALRAGVAAASGRYRVQWSRFDNVQRRHEPVGDAHVSAAPAAPLPEALASAEGYIAAAVSIEHPDHPHWTTPVTLYFRRNGSDWQPVGLVRDVPPRQPAEAADE